MRIFIGSIATESNTYAFAPTGARAFVREAAVAPGAPVGSNPWRLAVADLAAEDGHDVRYGLMADAQPSGSTVRAAYEALREELLADLGAAMPVDAVILPLHGAMVADGYVDCEGDILEHVRAMVGPRVPIGVELDLHCHFTDRMRRSADVI